MKWRGKISLEYQRRVRKEEGGKESKEESKRGRRREKRERERKRKRKRRELSFYKPVCTILHCINFSIDLFNANN